MIAYRYAIYFAPPSGSALWQLASAWLGRDAATGERPVRPSVTGIAPSAMAAMTEEPARYGFHATLKAPFRMKANATERHLLDAVRRFASTRTPVSLPGLVANTIGNFIALTPAMESSDLAALAAACVETFDPLRAPLVEAEQERRRWARLTPREEELLQRWGYPYVMEAFRFHMTLTGPIAEPDSIAIRDALAGLFGPLIARPLVVDALTVFEQPLPDAPFRILERFPFPGCA